MKKKKNDDTIYEFKNGVVVVHSNDDKNSKKKASKIITTSLAIALLGTSTYVLIKDPYIIPKTFDAYYYSSSDNSNLKKAIDGNKYLNDNLKEKIYEYSSKFINDYRDYLDYDLICSVFNNLKVIYEIDKQDKYNTNEIMKGFYSDYDIVSGNYNTIIMFDYDNEVLAHEVFHVISRYSGFELNEGMAEILKSETNNMQPNSYGPMIFHIKMLSQIIDKDSMLKDFTGQTTYSTKMELFQTGAFGSISEVNTFLKEIQNETMYMNSFIDSRDSEDLEGIQKAEAFIMEVYKKIFTKLDMNYPEGFNMYEILVDNYSNSDEVNNLYLYVDNTNIYYDNGIKTKVNIKKVSSNVKVNKKGE